MFQKMLVLTSVFIIAAVAQAQSSGGESEFFFQSKAGQSDLTPRLGYKMATFKDKLAGATETKWSGLYKSGLSYEYGINEMFSLEGTLSYTSLENDETPKTKGSGLQDPTIMLKGTSVIGAGNLRYGGILGLGFEKTKVTGNDINIASGGYSLAPYIGMDTEMGGGILGARAMYTYKMERTMTLGNGNDVKSRGGNELGVSAFYEYLVTDMLLGGSLNYLTRDKEEDVSSGYETRSSENFMGISLYSRIPMGTWALIPKVDYDFYGSDADKWDDLTLSVAGRFTF